MSFSWGEVAAGAAALLSFVFSMVKISVTKLLTKIDHIDKSLQDLKNVIIALEVKVGELQGIKAEIKESSKNSFEVFVRVADLKKDVDAAHAAVRELKRELQ